MADWIDSKRFAERWPFVGGVVLLTASALAVSFLPPTVSRDGKTFFLIVLYLLWINAFRTRPIRGDFHGRMARDGAYSGNSLRRLVYV